MYKKPTNFEEFDDVYSSLNTVQNSTMLNGAKFGQMHKNMYNIRPPLDHDIS